MKIMLRKRQILVLLVLIIGTSMIWFLFLGFKKDEDGGTFLELPPLRTEKSDASSKEGVKQVKSLEQKKVVDSDELLYQILSDQQDEDKKKVVEALGTLRAKKYILDKPGFTSPLLQKALLFVLSNYDAKKSRIPTIIHQQYRTKDIPKKYSENVHKFRQENPGFLHVLWTDSDLDIFVELFYPDIYWVYKNLSLQVLKSDLARYLLILTFGGYYSDLDTEQIRPLSTWADGHDDRVGLLVGIEVDTDREDWKKWYPRSLQFCQWTFAAAPGHPVMTKVVAKVVENLAQHTKKVEETDVVHLSGPGPFTDAIFEGLSANSVAAKDLRNLETPKLVGDIYVLPITGFSPGVGHMGSKPTSDKEARIQHLFAGTWKSNGK
jgi:alpha 1,6-mannosyltransferase